MGRPKKNKEEVANAQPMSITELQPIVEEFIKRYQSLKNEQDLLKEDEKALVAEFSEKLDTKTLQLAMKTIALKAKVQHKETYDLLVEILERAV